MFCCHRPRKKSSGSTSPTQLKSLENGQQLANYVEHLHLNNDIHTSRLRGRKIRLLDLQPGAQTDKIICNLHEADLDENKSFEALSYVWGDPSVCEEILVNQEPFEITTNLNDALRRLRSPTTARRLWIDAISINQKDLVERSEQVRIMRDIYCAATRVVVWLGPSPLVDAQLAKSTAERVYEACKAYGTEIGEDVIDMARDGFSLAHVNLKLSSISNSEWIVLADMFAMPWFTRCWCVQEIAKAKDSLILYGASELSWRAIGVTASWLQSHQIETDFDLPAQMEEVNGFNALCMFEADDYAETGLLRILSRFLDLNATDPCDKVYAMLGLVKWQDNKCPIEIDYSRSCRDLYIATAERIIAEVGDLGVLSHVRHNTDYDGKGDLPSWVPDWSTSNDEMTLWMGWSFAGDEQPYNACAGNELTSLPKVVDGAIKVSGLRFDEVAHVSGPMASSMFNAQASLEDKKALLELWNECSAPSPPYENAFLAITRMSRTLTADMNANFEHLLGLDEEECLQFYADFVAFVKHLLETSDTKSHTIDPDDLIMDGIQGNWQRYKVAASRACDRRRYFQTSRGYYAIGPACMRKGDIAVVLYGGQVPHILRPQGKDYLFLGECYLMELMDGQAFTEYRNVCKEEEFNLV